MTALITGATGGIGREIARLFALRGAAVAVHYHQAEKKAEDLILELRQAGCKARAYCADISDGAAAGEMVQKAEAELGGIDVLVNNAGVSLMKLFTDTAEEEWDRVFDVNVKGMYHCCRAALPGMIRNRRGSIVNLSSMWGLTGASCEVAYSASKAAVIGLTKALAKELGPSNVRVNCVAPGLVDTEMNRTLAKDDLAALVDGTPLLKMGTGRDVAEAVYFLASDAANFITGQVLSPNGGFVI